MAVHSGGARGAAAPPKIPKVYAFLWRISSKSSSKGVLPPAKNVLRTALGVLDQILVGDVPSKLQLVTGVK